VTEARGIEGEVSARGLRVAIVAARFNDFIVASLIKGASAAWLECGGSAADLLVARVPGAFELPLAAKKLGASGRYDAVVALGCVIRGDTPHFDYVAGECARGLGQASLETGVPVAFGVLTVETVEQALERAATTAGNKGGEAMESALEMASLLKKL
jgi:6,7-dimethyl-8-ribityllumazine synthase